MIDMQTALLITNWRSYHPWVNLIFRGIKAMTLIACRRKNPMINFYDRFKDKFKDTTSAIRARQDVFNLAAHKVSKRLDEGTTRPDFFTHIIKNQNSEEKALTRDEMNSNAMLLLNAGSETTATTLSGTTFLLLKDPERLAKLVKEIRGAFKEQAEITLEAVGKLPFLIACLQEGLRYYPPVPTGFPRLVPPGKDTISGHYIPEGVSFSIPCPGHRNGFCDSLHSECRDDPNANKSTSRHPCMSLNTQPTTRRVTTLIPMLLFPSVGSAMSDTRVTTILRHSRFHLALAIVSAKCKSISERD